MISTRILKLRLFIQVWGPRNLSTVLWKQEKKLRSVGNCRFYLDGKGKPPKNGHDNPLFTTSKFYPDFATRLPRVNEDGFSGIQLLEKLETLSNKKQYGEIIELFNVYHCRNPDWLPHWPAQRIAAVVLYAHRKAGLFSELYSLYDKMTEAGFKHGEGIYITLIKCSLYDNNWKRALNCLELLKKTGLRNVRIYPEIIKNLIVNGQFEKAMDLFDDMQKSELRQKTKKQLHDQTLLVEMLDAISGHYLEKPCVKIKREVKTPSEFMGKVLDYLTERCFILSIPLANSVAAVVNQLTRNFSLEIAKKHPTVGKSFSNDAKLNEREIRMFLEYISSRVNDDMGKREIEDLERFTEAHGPFGFVIDGSNVLLSKGPGYHMTQTKFKSANLLHLLEYCQKTFKLAKSVLVVSSAFENRTMFSRSRVCTKMKADYEMEVVVVSYLPEDIAFLLMCLFSCLHIISKRLEVDVKLITNDYLRDHISVLEDNRWRFLNWIRSRHWRYSWNWNNQITLHRALFMEQSTNKWILPLEDGRELTIKRKQF